jgi:hypothetical protein
MSRVLFQGHDRLRLGARYWLGPPNGWDLMGRPQVICHSVGEPVHPIFIGSTGRSYLHPQIRIEIRIGRRIAPISLPQPAIIGLLKIKKEIIIFNSIKIITYKIKMLNEHTTKCWARLSMNYCTPFWRSSLCTCVSTNNSIDLTWWWTPVIRPIIYCGSCSHPIMVCQNLLTNQKTSLHLH